MFQVCRTCSLHFFWSRKAFGFCDLGFPFSECGPTCGLRSFSRSWGSNAFLKFAMGTFKLIVRLTRDVE